MRTVCSACEEEEHPGLCACAATVAESSRRVCGIRMVGFPKRLGSSVARGYYGSAAEWRRGGVELHYARYRRVGRVGNGMRCNALRCARAGKLNARALGLAWPGSYLSHGEGGAFLIVWWYSGGQRDGGTARSGDARWAGASLWDSGGIGAELWGASSWSWLSHLWRAEFCDCAREHGMVCVDYYMIAWMALGMLVLCVWFYSMIFLRLSRRK